jgi:predicted nuclease of predicted toxin-antitoxin system
MTQPQPITFFIDRCLGGKCIAEVLRSSGITVEIHDEHFDKGAQDVEWIPEVGQRGWIVLTKDKNIGKRSLERIAVASAGIRMFALASKDLSGPDMAAIFLEAIIAMQEFARKHPAPFIAKIYRDGNILLWKDNQTLLEELNQIRDKVGE